MSDDRNTASTRRKTPAYQCGTRDLVHALVVVPNNRRPILGTMSEAETVVLAGLLDKLDALEEAVRVRPNAKAIAAFREHVEAWQAMGSDGREDRMAMECAAILLDTLDKIMAVAP